MWVLLTNALAWVVNFIFRASIMKFVFFTGFFLVFGELVKVAMSLFDMTGITSFQDTLSGVPAHILYYFGVFKLEVGVPIILGAYLTRFTIRRIPFIG